MWCVAELDDEYIAKMEDVLALYEKPYRSAEPVVCLDEKPVSLHDESALPPGAAWSHRQAGQRIQALRNGQHLRRRGTQGRAALQPVPLPIARRLSSPEVVQRSGRGLSLRSHHPPGHGQPQHPLPQVPHRSPRTTKRAATVWSRSRKSTTRPNTAVGSTRPKSNSAWYPGSASVPPHRRKLDAISVQRPRLERHGQPRLRPAFSGSSPAKTARIKFGYQRNILSGRRPSTRVKVFRCSSFSK